MLVTNMAPTNTNSDNYKKQSSSNKETERKIIEKNRRNQMKTLYSRLYSVIPNHNSNRDVVAVSDQLDEAINHIKSLEERLKSLKERKENLMSKKRSYACVNFESNTGLKSPQIEVYKMAASLLEVVLKTGLDNQFIFCEVVRILHEENADVVNARLSVSGDSVFHVIHAEIKDSMFDSGEARISERLKRYVSGSIGDVQEDFQLDLWDFDLQPILGVSNSSSLINSKHLSSKI